MDHTHQRRVTLEYVVNEWDRNDDAGGRGGKRQAGKSLDEGGEKCRRQVSRR